MSDTTGSSVAAQVARLYDTIHNRTPDAEGLAFWTNVIQTGINNLNGVADLFVASPEGQEDYGALGAAAAVNELYLNSFGRPADPAGQAFWASGLVSGAVDLGDVAVSISETPEHVAYLARFGADDPL